MTAHFQSVSYICEDDSTWTLSNDEFPLKFISRNSTARHVTVTAVNLVTCQPCKRIFRSTFFNFSKNS
ncbi:hypothetical protein JTE90_010232 [Oedothorax gibbosus]|uniref:Uncharacterized protein n=1 Tax=Oedothorax gibbosus TaxID=931172 RepID=A0AAV6TY55_9ARAC|nr:hypothetical protein JTE90_010232 [Oedothorax gibbosus]